MKFSILLLLFLSVNAYSQKVDKKRFDSLINSQKRILTQLEKLRQADSIQNIIQQNKTPLWDFAKGLREDNDKHREFLENYHSKIYLSVSVLSTIVVAVFSFMGFQTFRGISKRIERTFKEKFDDQFNNLWKEKRADIDKEMAEFRSELKSKKQIDEAQTRRLEDLDQKLTEIKKNILVKKSKSILQYNDENGHDVFYNMEQEIVCSSEGFPIHEIDQVVQVGEPGEVKLDSYTKQENVVVVVDPVGRGFKVTTKFNPPLRKDQASFKKFIKCRFTKGFLKKGESWTIIQRYPCEQEEFELRLLKGSPCKRVWVEKEHTKEALKSFQELEMPIKFSDDENHLIYSIEFPDTGNLITEPVKYRINWKY